MEILGRLPDPYIEVQDLCPYCFQPKRAYVRISEPPYHKFYEMKCGYCGKTPIEEDEKDEEYGIDVATLPPTPGE